MCVRTQIKFSEIWHFRSKGCLFSILFCPSLAFTHTHTRSHTNTHTYTHVCVCVFACVCVCAIVCVCARAAEQPSHGRQFCQSRTRTREHIHVPEYQLSPIRHLNPQRRSAQKFEGYSHCSRRILSSFPSTCKTYPAKGIGKEKWKLGRGREEST